MASSRGRVLAVAIAVCAALAATGVAEAKSKKKRAAAAPVAAAAPAATCPGPMASGPAAMPGMGGGAGLGEPLLLHYFDQIDADKSGELSRAEITAWIGSTREQMRQQFLGRFRAADANGDGRLSRDEAQGGTPGLFEHFEVVDLNGDGLVSLTEIEQLRDPERLRARVLERVRQADQDRDGRLNLAEVQVAFPGLAARFTLLDRDGDGYLTPEDFGRHLGGF
jgi:Ca2+-binding EF-hand superfamily protein